jgi:CrcB protein
MTVLMIAIGAFVGAPARYLADRAVQSRWRGTFPWGTLAVNVVASLVLGVVGGAGAGLDPDLVTLFGAGFCGTLSTYSTFSYETMTLAERGSRRFAVANVVLSLVAGIGAAIVGWSIGSALGP